LDDDGAGALRFTPVLPLVTTPGLLGKEIFDRDDRRFFILLLSLVTATGGGRKEARLATGATLLFLFDLSAFFFDDDDDEEEDDDENSGIFVEFVFVVTVCCCIGRSAIFDATESDGNSSTFFGDAGVCSRGCFCCCCCCCCCLLLLILPHDAPVGSDVDDDDGTAFAVPDDFPSSGMVGTIVGTTSFDQGLALVALFFFADVIDEDNVIDDGDDDDDAPSGGLRKSFTEGE
jgi:hypothetical protein